MIRLITLTTLSALALSVQVQAQDARQTCSKMQADGRLGPLTFQQCLCNYAVADQVLDADIRALLFDSWYNGTNNMDAAEKLTPRTRVRREMKELQRALVKHC